MKLTGRTILITGGSAGIGLAFAERFLELGNQVIVTGRRESKLAEVKRQHPQLHTVLCDAADPAQIAWLAKLVRTDFPNLDVLINNAGFSVFRNLATYSADLDDLLEEVDTNVGGVVRTTSALIDLLIANRGSIVNVSSALAFVPMPSMPIYCATKAAVHSYTQSLRFQLKNLGVKVIEIMPPAVQTDMTANLPAKGISIITTAQLLKKVLPALEKGVEEIRPGQANVLALMSRIAPRVIGNRLWKASQGRIP